MIKALLYKNIGGCIGRNNLICSTSYKYDDQTFEYKGNSSLYDGGKLADKEGHFTFDSIKSFIESKGKTKLINTTQTNS